MPIYEYVCQKCGNVFEVLQKVDQDEAGQDCPACHSHELIEFARILFKSMPRRGIAEIVTTTITLKN